MATFTVMADVPNPIFDSNGDPFSGAVLKAFLPGGTTSTSIAIDSSGSSPQSSITYNAEGQLEVTGNEILPYIDRTHKWGIFANAVDAAANTPFYLGPFNNVGVLTIKAPSDGNTYIQKDGDWQILDLGSNITIDSAQTGTLVKNTFWAVAATSARTRALPASPADGDEVTIFIASGDVRANNATIGRNGNTIDDIAADKVLRVSCIQKLKFNSAGSNWVSVLDTNRTLDGQINFWKELVRPLTNALIDADLGTWQTRTLAGNETLTFDLFSGQSVYLTVIPGANTLTLTNVTEWVGGAAPSTIEAEHAFVFWSDDGIAVTGMSIGGIS